MIEHYTGRHFSGIGRVGSHRHGRNRADDEQPKTGEDEPKNQANPVRVSQPPGISTRAREPLDYRPAFGTRVGEAQTAEDVAALPASKFRFDCRRKAGHWVIV